MHTTHGSSDLSIEMKGSQGDTGATICHPKPPNLPPNAKPPPQPLQPHQLAPWLGLTLGPPPTIHHQQLTNDAITMLPLGPPPSQTHPTTQAPCVSKAAAPKSGIPPIDIEHWCNHNGLGGCAPWNVTWRYSKWFWFKWYPDPHLEWQQWWRDCFFRCRRCNRLHYQCYEHSIWHYDPTERQRWYRINL